MSCDSFGNGNPRKMPKYFFSVRSDFTTQPQLRPISKSRIFQYYRDIGTLTPL